MSPGSLKLSKQEMKFLSSVSTLSQNLAFSFSSIRIASNTYQIFTVKFR
ncbi:hypothetical protein AB77_4638 [Escherichia coli 3-373-03_S1_C3]|nr:hypothetical protein AB77_4638 [Escherichia coli 3-373-03_S1_C3]